MFRLDEVGKLETIMKDIAPSSKYVYCVEKLLGLPNTNRLNKFISKQHLVTVCCLIPLVFSVINISKGQVPFAFLSLLCY